MWKTASGSTGLRPDIIAGLTAAAVVIPKAMAYATIAGLPVQVGLYTCLVPMVIYAMLGTSRPLIRTLVEGHRPEVVVLDLSGVPESGVHHAENANRS